MQAREAVVADDVHINREEAARDLSSEVTEVTSEDVLTEQRQLRSQVLDAHHRRRLSGSCLDLGLTIIDNQAGSNQAAAGFGIDLGIISIRGSFTVTPLLTVKLINKLCFQDYKVEMGLDFRVGMSGSFALSGEFFGIARGGISVGGTLVYLAITPRAFLNAKVGSITGELPITIRAINLAIGAWLEFPVPKWCKKYGVKFPCGLRWGNKMSFSAGAVGININFDPFKLLGLFQDKTAPLIGAVQLEQISATKLKVDWGSLTDEESSIASVEVKVSAQVVGTTSVVEPVIITVGTTATSWEGAVALLGFESIPHGSVLGVCVRAVNTFKLRSTKCAAGSLRWDSEPPIMTAFYATHPLTGSFRRPPEECRAAYIDTGRWRADCAVPYLNESSRLRFAVRIAELPRGAQFKSASWAISRDGPCARTELGQFNRSTAVRTIQEKASPVLSSVTECRFGELIMESYRPIGYAHRLAAGHTANIFEINAQLDDIELVAGTYYVNLHMCDMFDNCAVRSSSYPVTVDPSPPLLPTQVFADRFVDTSADGVQQFFVNQTRISALWVYAGGDTARGDSGAIMSGPLLDDAESAMRDARADLYRLHPGRAEGKEYVRATQLVIVPDSGGVPQFAPYVNAKLPGPGDARANATTPPGLTLGAPYVLELILTNAAGGISRMTSPVIIADWTPPFCRTPRLFPGQGDVMVQAGVEPPGSTDYEGTRIHNWVSGATTRVTVYISEGTCIDDESGIHEVTMWVGTEASPVGDIEAPRAIVPGFYHQLPVRPPLDLEDRTECDECGSPIFVGVRCHNGANLRSICPNFGTVRVDGSPPRCTDGQVVLGHGRNKAFQATTNGFNVSKFANNLYDRETGIAKLTYELHDVASLDGSALAPPLRLTWVDHPGLPLEQLTVLGRRKLPEVPVGFDLYHGHTYRIQYTATNMIGMQGTPCTTSDVLIDTTPPLPGLVAILQHDEENEVPYPETRFYQYSQRVVRVAARNFTDRESGIDGYGVSIYRSDGFVILSEVWVGLQDFVAIDVYLEDMRTFYVNWVAYNRAELSTVVRSANVTIDATKPIIDYLRDTFGPGYRTLGGAEADVVAATDLEVGLLFSVRDDESGIREATWCLGPLPKTCDTTAMEPIHHEPRETLQGVRNLVDGATYFSTLTVLNNAGGWETSSSDGFTIDVSAPICGLIWDGPSFDRTFIGPTVAQARTVVSDDNTTLLNIATMIVSWGGFKDFISGIGGYSVALVPSRRLDQVHGPDLEFVPVGLASSTVFFDALEHNETYYGVVTVWDPLGNERTCVDARAPLPAPALYPPSDMPRPRSRPPPAPLSRHRSRPHDWATACWPLPRTQMLLRWCALRRHATQHDARVPRESSRAQRVQSAEGGAPRACRSARHL